MSDALQGFATGNRAGKSPTRPQEILTPGIITDFVRLVFGGEIALDPCAARDSELLPLPGDTVRALTTCSGPGKGRDGLVEPWLDRTFFNPPYRDLKKWLAKAEGEADGFLHAEAPKRIIGLVPVRSHRSWWRGARDEAERTGFVLELNPVKFVSYDAAFPAPLCLFGFNTILTHEESLAALKLGGVKQ